MLYPLYLMCNTMQRYKFESNSQLNLGRGVAIVGCVIPCKDTNLKAIHNCLVFLAELISDV